MNPRLTAFLLLVLLCMPSAFAQKATGQQMKEINQVMLLQRVYDKNKAAYKKTKTPKAKKAYVEATNALAYATMTAGGLAPKVKYPRALNLYREALKVDPANKVAKQNADMIVSIYKSMGRKVPGGG